MPITVSGTQITFNDGTNQTTAFTGSGGVTSLNGQTGAITNTTANAIGSYCVAVFASFDNVFYTPGSTVSGSSLRMGNFGSGPSDYFSAFISGTQYNPSFSGTWRAMSTSKNQAVGYDNNYGGNIWVRIS